MEELTPIVLGPSTNEVTNSRFPASRAPYDQQHRGVTIDDIALHKGGLGQLRLLRREFNNLQRVIVPLRVHFLFRAHHGRMIGLYKRRVVAPLMAHVEKRDQRGRSAPKPLFPKSRPCIPATAR